MIPGDNGSVINNKDMRSGSSASGSGINVNMNITNTNGSYIDQQVNSDGAGGVSPDGVSTAMKIIPLFSGSASRQLGQNFQDTPAIGDNYSISIFAKAAGYNFLQLIWSAGATGINSAYVNFDLSTGAVNNTSGLPVNILPLGGGWWRCSAVVPVTGNTPAGKVTAFGIVPALNSTRNVVWTGDGSSGIEMWGAQAEKINNSTSCIAIRIFDQPKGGGLPELC